MSDARIGLEVHVYLRTRAKLFCACSADVIASPAPNTNICPVCTGQPGAKPMAPNVAALEAAVDVARALGSALQPRARFLRKHYFYPDLPSNYQRTSEPIAMGGELAGARIREMHVEEDPGAFDPASGLVDYDRSGAPLLEIVTEPDLASAAHARRFLGELRLALGYLDAWREEAGVKADCNVSVAGGERAEVKNVNSMRNAERAIAYEVERQKEARVRGEPLPRETRHFDEASGRTSRLRAKESEADYRYLADPDLPPVDITALAARRPPAEGPLQRRARFALLVGASEEDVSPLLEERALADAFELAAARAGARAAFPFFVRDVRAELEYRKVRFARWGFEPTMLSSVVEALAAKRITPQVATRILRRQTTLATELGAGAGGPEDVAVAAAARDAIAQNPRAVADYRAGKATALNFLVGHAMKALRGRAPADAVRAAVEQALRQTQ
jgi:aspartyl-tRNA(Asn)/glutamyl-tRNA(Gln) amidotransferase subunit B